MSEQGSRLGVEAVRQAATDWFARLASDTASEADWAAFGTWLEAAPEHRAAFEAVEQLWVDLDDASPEATPAPIELIAMPRRARAARAWTPAALAASLVAVAGAGWWALRPLPPQVVETGIGQTTTIALALGGHADLSPSTRLNLAKTKTGEVAHLVNGSARFTITHDPSRPFVVDAGDVVVTDVGTVFQVQAAREAVKVSVEEGEVAIAKPTQAPVTLAAGDTYTANGSAPPTVAPTSHLLTPDVGRLVVNAEPLPRLAAELSQRFARPIRVDGGAKTLRFSGVLVLDAEDDVIRRLGRFLPISADTRREVIILRRREGLH